MLAAFTFSFFFLDKRKLANELSFKNLFVNFLEIKVVRVSRVFSKENISTQLEEGHIT